MKAISRHGVNHWLLIVGAETEGPCECQEYQYMKKHSLLTGENRATVHIYIFYNCEELWGETTAIRGSLTPPPLATCWAEVWSVPVFSLQRVYLQILQTQFHNLLQMDWNVVIHHQAECILSTRPNWRTLCTAAPWNELEGWNDTSRTTDHLLLSTGQTAYCTSWNQSCGVVAQLTGGLVFYLKNYTCLCPQPRISSWLQFKGQMCFCFTLKTRGSCISDFSSLSRSTCEYNMHSSNKSH